MGRLEGKTAIITGGSGGIGSATARKFLDEGANVVLVDLSADALDEAATKLDGGDRVLTVTADVTKEDDVAAYVKATVDRFGAVDVFFNNAGIEGKVRPITEQAVEDFDQVLAVNARGVFLGLKHVLKVMLEAGSGSVINMSSVAGLQGSPGVTPYLASKHAVVGLTRGAAVEVAAKGVRVNSVHPSPVETRMMRSLEEGYAPGAAPEAHTDFAQAIPMGRYGEPDEIADAVAFLASDDSKFITGVQLPVDGGLTT